MYLHSHNAIVKGSRNKAKMRGDKGEPYLVP